MKAELQAAASPPQAPVETTTRPMQLPLASVQEGDAAAVMDAGGRVGAEEEDGSSTPRWLKRLVFSKKG